MSNNQKCDEANTLIDTRVITLRSRSIIPSGRLPKLDAASEFYTFTYYDAIKITAANEGISSPLANAYEHATLEWQQGGDSVSSLQQTIMAFTDFAPDEKAAELNLLYRKSDIDAFWNDSSYPLFFVSMITIRQPMDLETVARKIKEALPEKRHLIYFSFDHCDALIFFRGNSFQEYANLLFRLNYSSPRLLEDSITLYGFSPSWENVTLSPESAETLGVYIRVGVTDYIGASKFYEKLKALEPESEKITFSWLLGRNDVSILNPSANLFWLKKIKKLAESCGGWFSTYDLSVLIHPAEDFVPEKREPSEQPEENTVSPKSAVSNMEALFKKFEEAYNRGCDEIGTAPDRVWLRWLRDSSLLAEDLLKNPMTLDLGTCLVPQFIDMLTYGYELFSSDTLTIRHMDAVRHCFSVFSGNVATLIDSMNHSNKQFVQVPAFHPVSFEMPPKVMAYFTVLGHRLIEILNDNGDEFGFTISPSFVDLLQIVSLDIHRYFTDDIIGYAGAELDSAQGCRDKFVSISVGEGALYSLQRTTMSMAHEISHYVGEKSRCRAERKEFVLLCAISGLIFNTMKLMTERLGLEDSFVLSASKQEEAAAAIYELYTEVFPEWKNPDKLLYMESIAANLRYISFHFMNDRRLSAALFDYIYETLMNGGKNRDAIVRAVFGKDGYEDYGDAPLSRFVSDARENRLKFRLNRIFLELLGKFYDWQPNIGIESSDDRKLYPISTYNNIYNLFRETLADLQSIMVLDLSWDEYSLLLENINSHNIGTRKLCVARALVENGIWQESEIVSDDPEISGMVGADFKELLSSAHTDIAAASILYISRYLGVCVRSISEYLGKKSEKLETLRRMYRVVRGNSPILELEKKMTEFIDSYRRDLNRGF